MTEDYILGNLDLASISLWLFFIFFVGLVIWIQRENQREGYPLVDEDGSQADAGSVFPNPSDKTFKLPHGRGDYTVPSGQTAERTDIDGKLTKEFDSGGFPFDPKGDPLADGVGPASWAPRRDEPELDGHGHPKIIPMSGSESFRVSAGRDPPRFACRCRRWRDRWQDHRYVGRRAGTACPVSRDRAGRGIRWWIPACPDHLHTHLGQPGKGSVDLW